jgi:hypothetical protein
VPERGRLPRIEACLQQLEPTACGNWPSFISNGL